VKGEVLPESWANPKMGECCELNPKFDKSTLADSTAVHFVQMPAVEALTNKVNISATRPFSKVKKGYTPFASGDVIFAKITPCMENGKIAVVPELRHKIAFGSTEFHVFRPLGRLDPLWFFYFLSSRSFRSLAEHNMTGAVGQRRVPIDFLARSTIPLPPLPEQKRIVAKIEELFSELEAGEESLRAARRQLGVYRHSLLKQAFEGKLTEKWRAEKPSDMTIQNVPVIAPNNELKPLSLLPKGWVWTHLSTLGELGRGKSKHRPRNDAKLFGGPYPFIQTGEVKAASKTVTTYTETYSDFGLSQSRLWPKGTLCITIAANIAETAFLGFDACFPDSVVGFVPNQTVANTEFVELFIRSVRSRIENFAPATAQKNINLATLENLVIPICSLPEQQEIVRILDAQFEAISQNEQDIDAALKRSEALRQAILKKAFSGQLVPQDPADEPGSALLERIRAERAVAPNKTRKKRSDRSV
jgi:type I restriction enzyme S subunit